MLGRDFKPNYLTKSGDCTIETRLEISLPLEPSEMTEMQWLSLDLPQDMLC